MAALAVLCDRRMLPDHRTALVGVTIKTELLGVIGFDHTFAEAAVGGMAGRAADFALKDWMMGAFVCFNFDVAVTTETDLRLVRLLPATSMKVMTGITRDIISFVGTHVP